MSQVNVSDFSLIVMPCCHGDNSAFIYLSVCDTRQVLSKIKLSMYKTLQLSASIKNEKNRKQTKNQNIQ